MYIFFLLFFLLFENNFILYFKYCMSILSNNFLLRGTTLIEAIIHKSLYPNKPKKQCPVYSFEHWYGNTNFY